MTVTRNEGIFVKYHKDEMKKRPITPGFFAVWKLYEKRPQQNLTITFIAVARARSNGKSLVTL